MAKFKPQQRPQQSPRRINSNDFMEAFERAGQSFDDMGRDAYNLV